MRLIVSKNVFYCAISLGIFKISSSKIAKVTKPKERDQKVFIYVYLPFNVMKIPSVTERVTFTFIYTFDLNVPWNKMVMRMKLIYRNRNC